MPVPLVRRRPDSARRGQYCGNCKHAAPVTTAGALPETVEHVRGCSWHEWIVLAAVWCEDWTVARDER